MRRFLWIVAAVAAVGFISGHALGAPLILNPTKDTTMGRYSSGTTSEQNFNGGNLGPNVRYTKNVYLTAIDFDVHQKTSGVLYDWLVANGFTPTGAGAKAAIDGGQLEVQVAIAQVGTQLNGGGLELRTIDCITDWAEGNGSARYPNFGWTNLGGAATFINPNQILPSEGSEKGPGWGPAGDKVLNAAPFTKISTNNMEWDDVANSFAYTTLTSEGVRQLLDEPLNRGFYTSYTKGSLNGYGYDRTNATYAPQLIFTVVPEPATMVLLALGGLALIRRRA